MKIGDVEPGKYYAMSTWRHGKANFRSDDLVRVKCLEIVTETEQQAGWPYKERNVRRVLISKPGGEQVSVSALKLAGEWDEYAAQRDATREKQAVQLDRAQRITEAFAAIGLEVKAMPGWDKDMVHFQTGALDKWLEGQNDGES